MKLAWRLLWRDAKGGELWLLVAALVLAVAATTSLRFFSVSLDQGLRRQAASLIAADLVVASTRPIQPGLVARAQADGLRQTRILEFASVIQKADNFQLAAIKAVEAGYPLRGELKIRDAQGDHGVRTIPAPGSIWMEERLLALLGAQPGDRVQLGDTQLTIGAVLAKEPDRGGNFAVFSPRALINAQDVAAAHVIQPGSRVQYRLLLSGAASAVSRFQSYAKPHLQPAERLLDVAGGRPEIGSPLQKAADYLALATVAAVVLAGVAVALSARRFGERHYDALALLRCLGATQKRVRGIYLQQIGIIWLASVILGSVLGFLASQGLFLLLKSLLPLTDLPFAWGAPLLIGVATASLTLVGFALPALIALFQVSPLRVLRRELAPPGLSTLAVMALALAALYALLLVETGQVGLTSIVLLGGSLLALVVGGLLHLALRLWRHREAGRPTRNVWYLGVRELWRRPQATVAQVLGFALGMTAMLLVFSLRGELLNAWQAKLPPGTPNQFAMGIPADQMAAFDEALQQAHFQTSNLYPVVRGRLVTINGRPIKALVGKSDTERDEALTRELNLTWSDHLPAANKLIVGRWWGAGESPYQVSLESKVAERLGVHLGDRLGFSMLEGNFEARVTSLRTVDWESFQPNFFMVLPRGALQPYPASYLTSFYVAPAQRPALNHLVRQFPTVVLIDVAAVMDEVRSLLDQVSRAIEFVLAFVLAAGVLVLWACVAASLDSRRREAALLRALGASRRQLQQRLGAEMLAVGAFSGLLAIMITEALAAALYVRVLDLPPRLHFELWLLTPALGAALTGLAGLWGARRIWLVPPVAVLKED